MKYILLVTILQKREVVDSIKSFIESLEGVVVNSVLMVNDCQYQLLITATNLNPKSIIQNIRNVESVVSTIVEDHTENILRCADCRCEGCDCDTAPF